VLVVEWGIHGEDVLWIYIAIPARAITISLGLTANIVVVCTDIGIYANVVKGSGDV
jgi:hypothetical protein